MAEPPEECRGYIRQPTVNGDRIAFVAEDDVWLVGCEGGRPRRLTNFRGAFHPLFSPSGEQVAFTVASDVWVLEVRSARPRRLTWFGGGAARAAAWAPSRLPGRQAATVGGSDGECLEEEEEEELIVASNSDDPHERPQLYAVALRGGTPRRLFSGDYDALVHQVGGPGLLLGRHTFDPVVGDRWKGYRGGKSGFVWLDRQGTGTFKRLALHGGAADAEDLSVSCLMWGPNDRIWFVADPDGSGNLWSVTLDGQSLTKHTEHELFDVRNAKMSADASRAVYTCGGELWAMVLGGDSGDGRPERIAIDFGAPLSHLPQFLPAEEHCDAVVLHPDGHHCACLCRGQAFEMALWEGPAVQMRSAGPDPGRAVRCVEVDYLCSGRLLTVTDELLPTLSFTIHPSPCLADTEKPTKAQEWINLLVADSGAGMQHVRLEQHIGNIYEMVCSPAHDAVVVTTNRNELVLIEFVPEVGEKPHPQKDPMAHIDLPLSLEAKVLDSSEWEEGLSEPCWSPDGEWLAYARKDSRRGASIVLLHLETGEKTTVSDSGFENYGPCFDPDGRFLSFFSCRTFAPFEDEITMDLNFSCGSSLPYLVLLQQDSPNPFQRAALSPAEQREREGDDDGGPQGGDDDDEDDGDVSGSEGGAGEDAFTPPEKIQVDVEGIGDRVVQFPLPFGRYSNGQWTDSGKFQYLRGQGVARQPGVGGEEDESQDACCLFAYSFVRLKEEKLGEHVQDYQLSMDLRNMLLDMKGPDGEEEYHVHVAGQKLPGGEDDDENLDADLDKPGPESGILDIGARVSLEVVPEREWSQIFEEVCQHVRENFFDEATGGVDWEATCASYRAVLPRLRSRSELTDLCSELLAELGVSHMSVSDPEVEEEGGPCSILGSHGHLGLQVTWQEMAGAGGAYRVDQFTKGDVWDMRYSGPLARAGVGITEGSYIVAVNRTRVCKEVSLDQMLANSGSSEVFLTFVPPESAQRFAQVQGLLQKSGGVDGFRRLSANQRKALEGQGAQEGKKRRNKKKDKKTKKYKGPEHAQAEAEKQLAAILQGAGIDVSEGPIWRSVRVRAASMETRRNASLRDVVEHRMRLVHEATEGRAGYVHVPDTCELGFAEFYRYYGRECDRQGLIVDLRCNGGGYATELLLKQLRNAPMAWNVSRPGRGRVQVSPDLCAPGKMVLLIDENTASDGECWAEAFKRFGMGKVVGVRTWGGVVSVGGADLELLDGGELSIPSQHYLVPGLDYGLENHGVAPDVAVDWPPDAAGDPQLEEAVRQVEEMLAASSPSVPEIPKFPTTRLHRRR